MHACTHAKLSAELSEGYAKGAGAEQRSKTSRCGAVSAGEGMENSTNRGQDREVGSQLSGTARYIKTCFTPVRFRVAICRATAALNGHSVETLPHHPSSEFWQETHPG